MLLAVRPLMNLTLSDEVDIIVYGNANNLTGTDTTRFRLQQQQTQGRPQVTSTFQL